MDDLIILTASTVGPNHPESGTLALYLSQLEAAGINHHCEPLTSFPANGGSLSYKVAGLRRMVNKFLNYHKIVFSDGHDVQFFGQKEYVLSKIPDAGVLLAAERNCYPEPGMAAQIHNPLPWRYVNAGWLAGTSESFLLWLEAIERHPMFSPEQLDQAFFNRLLAAGDPLIHLDDSTELCYCTFGEENEIADLQWKDDKPFNRLTLTTPAWIHCNGHWNSDHIYARRNK